MRRQVRRTLVVLMAIMSLIAGQLWVAAYACETIGSVSSSSLAVSSASMISMSSSRSHGDLHNQGTANLCQAHCDNTGQLDHAPQSTPSPAVWLPLIWGHSSVQACAEQLYVPDHTEPPLKAAFPPPRILFQVLRT
jgi:hypothetical protein